VRNRLKGGCPKQVTTLPGRRWEARLLHLAAEAPQPEPAPSTRPVTDAARLRQAFAHCAAVTRAHSRSFHLATALLPAAKRQALHALYAVCRISDDLVDCREAEAAFRAWRAQVLSPDAAPNDPVLLAWVDTRQRYAIPPRYTEQLLEGVAQDLRPRPVLTFDDLAAYAYGVASTVGLMSMHIIGYAGPKAVPYAIKLGVALQLTNILRDVGEDLATGRLYLPLTELAQFRLTQRDLASGLVDDRWRAFMRFQINRNRQLYAEAWPGIRLLHRDGRLAVTAAADFYSAILDDIESHDYDVLHRRAHLGALAKLCRLPGLWWRSRR
jgi:15-cis-phytoene synthase